MEDKSYWKQYSSIESGSVEMFINTENGDWAVFKNGVYLTEGADENIPPEYKNFYSEFWEE